MALSDYEREVLEQMEADLSRADPQLQQTMQAHSDSPRHLNARLIAAGTVLALAGLGVVLGGVSASTVSMWLTIALGVVGFVMMVGGVWLALHCAPVSTSSAGSRRVKKQSQRSGWAKFVADQERRWDQRER